MSDPESLSLGNESVKTKSDKSKARSKRSLTWDYLITFVSEFFGTVILVAMIATATALSLGLDDGYAGILTQAFTGAAAMFVVYAIFADMSMIFNFFALIFACMQMLFFSSDWWSKALINKRWIAHLDGNAIRKGTSKKSMGITVAIVIGFFLIAGGAQAAGSIVGGWVTLALLPGSDCAVVGNCGQPHQVTPIHWVGPNLPYLRAETYFADAFGGFIVKLTILVAFGAVKRRFGNHVTRAAVVAASYLGANLITSFSINSGFNFLVYFGTASIGAHFHPDWWIWFVGDVTSWALAVVVHWFILKDSWSEYIKEIKTEHVQLEETEKQIKAQ